MGLVRVLERDADPVEYSGLLPSVEGPPLVMKQCTICRGHLPPPVLETAGRWSVTSACELLEGRTRVYFCTACEHLQTEPLADLGAYYDSAYNFLADSEEEDQIYKIVDGEPVYRLEHQAKLFLEKCPPPRGARVLDYGCAKGLSLKRIRELRPDIEPALFDVSEAYVPFWRRFLKDRQWAVYRLRDEWAGAFDVVTSFFALEHVADPHAMLADVRRILKPGGLFYCVVPNVLTNNADYVVVDHVNHFTRNSLAVLLAGSGFQLLDCDDTSHEGALVFTARPALGAVEADLVDGAGARRRLEDLRRFWQGIAERVREFERAHPAQASAIYGAGFYGTYIATCLERPERIRCFVDRNPHLQGRSKLGKTIVSPEALSDDVSVVYVGLRPAIARPSIDSISEWRERALDSFYL